MIEMSGTNRLRKVAAALTGTATATTRTKAVMTALVLIGESEIAAVEDCLPSASLQQCRDHIIDVYRSEVAAARSAFESELSDLYDGISARDLPADVRQQLAAGNPDLYRRLTARRSASGRSASRPQQREEPEFSPSPGVQLAGTMYHMAAAYRLRTNVLGDARRGVLAPDWRAHLTVAVLHGGPRPDSCSTTQADAEDLALHEVLSEPPAAWEPFAAGGDSHAALDAWHTAAIHNETTLSGQLLADSLNAVLARYGHAEIPRLPESRRHMESVSSARRAYLDASHRAGLTDDHADVDWLTQYRAATAETVGPISTAIASVDADWLREQFALPDYWITKQ